MALVLPQTIENDTPADASELQQNFSAIQTYVNTNVLHRDGSVGLTGPLLLPGDPTQPNHAANKEYVDGRDALYLPLAGGTVTGQVKGIAPVADNDLTRKDYVDTMLPLAGGTVTGQIKGITPVADADLARKDYVDTQVTTALSPTEGDARYVNLTGDTMTGPLIVGTEGVTADYIQVGGLSASEQRGVLLRADGAVASRMEGAIGIASGNLFLDRAGSTASDPGGIYVSFNRASLTTSSSVRIGSICINAGGSGVDYLETSDYRVKDDLGPIDNAVQRLMGLRPKRFRYKESGYEQDGFIAHEVADVVPNAVSGEKDATDLQQLAPMRLIPLLVAAVQQLTARVAELEAVT